MINLGDKVKDTITDFEGTAVAKIIYLNGCVRCEVKPKGLKDGGGTKVLDTPLKYRKEMLCDWRGAGRAQGSHGNIKE